MKVLVENKYAQRKYFSLSEPLASAIKAYLFFFIFDTSTNPRVLNVLEW